MEVRAVDVNDGLEVAFIAPVNTPDRELEIIARRKLTYVRRKRERGRSGGASATKPSSDRRRRGIIV